VPSQVGFLLFGRFCRVGSVAVSRGRIAFLIRPFERMGASVKIRTLAYLYLDQLQDIHSCERQLVKALPKMAKSATHPKLKAAFTSHLDVTRTHIERLDAILEDLEKSPGRKVCAAAAGLIEEGSELIAGDADEEARDAGLICAAQKIEHYEIASYGCLRTFATLLDRAKDAKSLERTLAEEKASDVALTKLAMSVVNEAALSEHG